MSVFLSKHPSTRPRVLDATDCPPHNILHDIQTYPLFYDALYYPQYNDSIYATADKFCCWLQLSLASHCNSLCLRCGPLYQSVAVVFAKSAPPNSRDANGSRAYQLILRHMELLPCRMRSLHEEGSPRLERQKEGH